MNLSINEILHAKALQAAVENLESVKGRLEAHLKADYEAVKLELEEVKAHFESEVARLKSIVHPRVVEHVNEGSSVNDAIHKTQQDFPTNAEQTARIEADAAAQKKADEDAALAAKAAEAT